MSSFMPYVRLNVLEEPRHYKKEKRGVKMNRTKIILGFGLALVLFFNFALAGLSEKSVSLTGEKENRVASGFAPEEKELHPNPFLEKETKVDKRDGGLKTSATEKGKTPGINSDSTKTKTSAPANFILITDVIDGYGGQRYNGGCDLSIFAGGQSSAIGSGTSTNFKLYAGFIYPTIVKCGDANADGALSVSDVVYIINYLFKGGPPPMPWEAGESNCDGNVSVSDVVNLINYLFKGGSPPIC